MISSYNIYQLCVNINMTPNVIKLYINPSIIKINDEYLISFRKIKIPNLNTFRPGNISAYNVADLGHNFMWSRWKTLYRNEKTVFYVGNYKISSTLRKIKHHINLHDVRMVKINDLIYMYGNNVNTIYVYEYIYGELIFIKKIYNTPFINNNNNIQILDIKKNNILFTNWIYDNGVYIRKNDTDIIKIYFEKGYEFNGNGSIIKNIPKISFSTPHINFIYNNQNIKIGVGHSKIHNNENNSNEDYNINSNIYNFRENLHKKMRNLYQHNYIINLNEDIPTPKENPILKGHIYMLYFYYFIDNKMYFENKSSSNRISKDCSEMYFENKSFSNRISKDCSEMYISDSYLPIIDNKIKINYYDDDYIFSLFFPCGLERINETQILVTGGYGDFYSYAIEFNIDQIIGSCIHNISCINFDNYNYYMLTNNIDLK